MLISLRARSASFFHLAFAITLIAIASFANYRTLAQPVEGLPPLADEPVVIPPQGSGAPDPDAVGAALWPALFSKTYVPGQSTICIACEIAAHKYQAYLVGPPGSATPIQLIGSFEMIDDPIGIPWMENGSLSELGTHEGVPYATSAHSRTRATAGILITSTGQWSVVSGTVTDSINSLTVPAGTYEYTIRFLTIYATHEAAAAAADWAEDFASGDIFTLQSDPTPGNDGGETPAPNYDGYRECKAARQQQRIDDLKAIELEKNNKLGDLDNNTSVLNWAFSGAGTGAAAGAAGGAVCAGLGAIPGGILGAAYGFVGGALYGQYTYDHAKQKILTTYRANKAVIEKAYRDGLKACREAYNIPPDYDVE